MKEKTLLKIALVTSLVGLAALYLISGSITIKETNIEKITLGNKDDMVKIRGVVSNVIDAESVAILEVTQPQEITVVMFKDGESIELDKGNEIEVIGRVDEYQGELEIIAERIRIIR